jgi:choline dehydrogenase
VVGGSGSINGMLFVRGNAKNYGDWAECGCPGWSYGDVLGSFKKMENCEDGATDLRGAGRPIQVTRQRDLTPASLAFMAALAEVAGVPSLDDYNGKPQEGLAIFQQSVHGGLRYSSSVGYLDDHGLPNLTLITRVVVARVILDKGGATGVEMITNKGRTIIRASREVILSAGVFGVPADPHAVWDRPSRAPARA